jgi:hypothetical protein
LLPDGAFISMGNQAYLVKGGHLYLWTPFGYEGSIDRPASGKVVVLTPLTIVNAFRAGYRPQIITC